MLPAATPLGRLTSRSNTANPGGVTYSYDKTGNLATANNVAGTTSYSYDDRNLVTTMTPADNRIIRFGYDDAGRRTDTWFNTNSTRTTWAAHSHTDYNEAGQVTRIWSAEASNDASRVSDLAYSYEGDTSLGDCPTAPAGTMTSLRWVQLDVLTNVYTNYCYDSSNRLTQVDPGAGSTFVYAYDANGNRVTTDRDGSTVQTQTVNAADQLTMAGYVYDAAGNLTATPAGSAAYNAANQMVGLGGGAGSYSYADTDQVELITDPSGRSYTYGRAGSTGLPLVESYTQGGTSYAYLYDPTGTPLAIQAANTHYLALDGLGSVIATINHNAVTTTSYRYDAWGNQTATPQNSSGINAYQIYGYTGGIPDPTTGLLHLGRRWYDPATGRFTQRDAIESLADPSRANRYEYAGDNPINFTDPTGAIGEFCTLSPDRYRAASFRSACAIHDACYAAQRGKHGCDVQLLGNLLSACQKTYGHTGFNARVCAADAHLYFGVVDVLGGLNYFLAGF